MSPQSDSRPGVRGVTFCLALLWGIFLIATPQVAAETVEGFLEPFKDIEIVGASEPGLINSILVEEGDRVTQGQILATLENGVLEASLRIAEKRSKLRGRLEAARAELRMRRDRAQKLRQLRSEGHASPAELERAETDLQVAMAQVVLADEELELAVLECQRIQAQIEQRIFRSPIDGVVSEVLREEGESIQITDPSLMKLVQLNPLRVSFPVSISSAETLQQGGKIELTIPETDSQISATVHLVSPVVDAKSGTVEVQCMIDNAAGALRSGMRCLFRVGTDSKPEAEVTASPLATHSPSTEW